jgi:ATP-dependent Clp protease ATP-binding subunit ClpC
MFERYTEQARRALFFARYEASQRGSMSIESEHLLLGLIQKARGPVNAILAHFQVMPLIMLREIDVRAPPKEERVAPSVEIPFSREVQHVLNGARLEADRLRHPHIGPEHLFLALLIEDQSVAASVLNQQGVTLEAARDHIATQPVASSPSSTTAPVDGRLQAIKLLVEQLGHADRSGREAAELVARIHQAIDALKPHLQ